MDSLAGGTNAIILLLTILALTAAAIMAFVAWRKGRIGAARAIVVGATMLGLAYAGGVVVASAASTERVLPAGETKWFCGFYLDCHLGMSIERTETAVSIPGPSGELKASGLFHIVTLKLHNNARNPEVDMTLYEPIARAVDAAGREYPRSSAAEMALAKNPGRAQPLPIVTKVTHEPALATIVFDIPSDAESPRLEVRQGWILDRAIARGLIADENSIFHRKTLLSLDGSGR